MIKERVHPYDGAATDLAAAIIANSAAFHKEVFRLYTDVRLFHTKVEATHREIDRLHPKSKGPTPEFESFGRKIVCIAAEGRPV